MKSKDLKFEKLIWDRFSQEKEYDQMRFKLIRTREIMSGLHLKFENFPVQMQFDFCITIAIIVIQTSTQDLIQLSLSGDKNEMFKYSIDDGFVPPVPIEFKNRIKQ